MLHGVTVSVNCFGELLKIVCLGLVCLVVFQAKFTFSKKFLSGLEKQFSSSFTCFLAPMRLEV